MDQVENSTKARKWKQLNEKDRHKIESLWQQGISAAVIGGMLAPKRDRRTIARGLTLQRNSDLTEKAVYLADVGQRKHEEN
ncbi:MAG: IS30 family transposase, partial [Clostridia bacterium]